MTANIEQYGYGITIKIVKHSQNSTKIECIKVVKANIDKVIASIDFNQR